MKEEIVLAETTLCGSEFQRVIPCDTEKSFTYFHLCFDVGDFKLLSSSVTQGRTSKHIIRCYSTVAIKIFPVLHNVVV